MRVSRLVLYNIAVHYSLASPDFHTRKGRLDGSLYGHLEVTADRLDTILEALADHLMLHHLHEEPEGEIKGKKRTVSLLTFVRKIPHTGDTESLDRCGS